MSIENNFSNHSKEYIFLDNETLSNQREKVFKKIIKKNYDKKNNESLKNITISDLEKFDYFYKPIKEVSKVSSIDNFNYEIKLVNGICKISYFNIIVIVVFTFSIDHSDFIIIIINN